MYPSEIRIRVIEDHDGFRERLKILESRSEEAAASGSSCASLDDLRKLSESLLARLREHMRWEEHYLLPALREADAWGEERAQRMLDDHREQREQLDFILGRLRDPDRPDPLVVNDVRGLIALLREDMIEEERDLLDERILRDDVIGIEVEAG